METRCRDHRWKALCNVSGSIKCSSTANCVLPQWLLDGKDDCGDGSDEGKYRICSRTFVKCFHGISEPCRLIECSTTIIASATSTTAATSVPPENSTPVGVSSAPGIRICETGEFRCLSGECVEEGRVLDGVKDCWDSSDEKYCELVSEECSSESPCAYQPDIAAFGCGCAKGSVPDEKGICQPTKT
ncbi:Low-density lipoprotein receptor domain class A [Necator americanus]|uniref:Low-density lipoprotein receptor domain class A n=1 Tax=Necator americanus TaxID=51031 RepID=W2T083_NECAM|nr:Low-density lipoprotein receptor domain class A [Necator americanus]ETN74372.1 Low-density lipoprotein receptor domain class A [Necator americanus]